METTLTPWRPGLGMTAFDDASNYMGDKIEGYFVLSKHRDSPILDVSNYDVALKRLTAIAETLDREDCVLEPSFNHWAIGYVDQICLKADAPEAVIREAEAIQTDMAEYPILDEMDCSEREWEACCEYWDGLSPRAKVQDAMYERDKRHWTKGERVWVYGRMSYGDLANYGSEISESLLESIKEGCCY